MRKIKVIGVGPGSPACITREALAAIKESPVLIGGKRHLKTFAGENQEQFIISGDMDEVLDVIKGRREDGVAVLASGDPGMYGILNYLSTRLEDFDIEVIPGISSVQVAFARLSLPWHDAVILSAHGRSAENVAQIAKGEKKVAVLTGPESTPEKLFSLISRDGMDRRFYFCFDLSLPGESILRLRTGDEFPAGYRGRHNCVVVILNGK
ncbi:MAG: precorrin-6y C5,15-methyltransferase (decarboxylating) subunit CbiE [Bacillota bacterium]